MTTNKIMARAIVTNTSVMDVFSTCPSNISSTLTLVPPNNARVSKPIENKAEKIIPIDVSLDSLVFFTIYPMPRATMIAL